MSQPEVVYRDSAGAEAASETAVADQLETEEHDPSATVKGILVSLLFAIAFWAVIGFTAWNLL